MDRELFINGRFLVQPLSGVQRFATEMTAVLQRVHNGPTTVLVPSNSYTGQQAVHMIGHRSGHAWEQTELPRHVGNGILLSLGNTGPLLMRRQILVVHDAGVFGVPGSYSWKFRTGYKMAQHCLARTAAQIVTVSEFSRSEIARYLAIGKDRITVVSEGADHMDRIVAEPNILSANGLAQDRFVLVVGNLAPHKNFAALDKLAIVLAQRNIPLVVTGGFPPAVFQSGGRNRLPQPARYLGRVSDGALKALYRAAACFVFPSRYEGFGLPAVEAMACSCPVVAADIPALRETCGDAVQYCDPTSPSDIAINVCRVIDDRTLRDRLRRAGHQKAGEFTWDKAGRKLDKVLQAAASSPDLWLDRILRKRDHDVAHHRSISR
jgi:glycosyltransferase involved in cell wall biosynthesis